MSPPVEAPPFDVDAARRYAIEEEDPHPALLGGLVLAACAEIETLRRRIEADG